MSPKNHRPKEREGESISPQGKRRRKGGKGRSVGQEGERGGAKMGKTANQGIGREGRERERHGESPFFGRGMEYFFCENSSLLGRIFSFRSRLIWK